MVVLPSLVRRLVVRAVRRPGGSVLRPGFHRDGRARNCRRHHRSLQQARLVNSERRDWQIEKHIDCKRKREEGGKAHQACLRPLKSFSRLLFYVLLRCIHALRSNLLFHFSPPKPSLTQAVVFCCLAPLFLFFRIS